MVRRIRLVLVVLGVLLVVGTLVGARFLSPGNGGDGPPKTALAVAKASGPVVIGFVDTDPSPATYGLPPIMQSGLVVEVFVTEGQEVKAGHPLFAFDATIPKAELDVAEKTLAKVRFEVEKANALGTEYDKKLEFQRQVVAVAEQEVVLKKETYFNAERTFRESNIKGRGFTPERVEELLKTDTDMFKLRAEYQATELKRDLAKAALKQLEGVNTKLAVDEAKAGVAQAEAVVAGKRAVVELCTVRAHVAGTIEQIHISKGTTMGVSTRGTAVSLIPAGPRIVRAEIEADFAHRVGSDKLDKEVTIQDHTDSKLVYKGVVKGIGTAFLEKRYAAGGLLGNDTRVLEARVVVTDPNPTGKHPLRVGQKVRVNFGP